ncbi:MAG: hypothetical protein P8Y95_05235, partial [Gammaproteobacteria bacterium]
DLSGASDVTLGVSFPGDPFGDADGVVEPEVTLTATLSGNVIDLLNFSNVTPNEVLGMLGGLLDTFTAMATNELFSRAVPFTDFTLGDILDYGKTFKEEVLDPLFTSGDFLDPDSNEDGVIDGADLKFDSIQELVHELGHNLGLPSLESIYDRVANSVSFTIDFERAFGLGDGEVLTTVQGDDPSNTDEVQLLSYDTATTNAFRLAFRDGAGILRITDPIDATQGVVALRNAIDSALESFAAIGANNVSVAGPKGELTITFDDSLGNVPQLGFAGELDIDFGASLGDFASVATRGSVGLAAVLDGGLTFGIDLTPSDPIQIAPAVAQTETTRVVVTTPGVDAAVSEEVRIEIREAEGRKYRLAFRPMDGEGAFTVSSAVTYDAASALADLTGVLNAIVGGGNFMISQDPDDERAFEVVFQGAHNQKDVELVGGAAIGVLADDATFDLTVVNESLDITERDGLGQILEYMGSLVSAVTIPDNSLGTVTVNVLSSDTLDNTEPDDLEADVLAAVNQALTSNGLTLGFYDMTSGALSTGTISAGLTGVTAGFAPSSSFASDVDFVVKIGSDELEGTLRTVDLLDTDGTPSDAAIGNLFDETGNLTSEADGINMGGVSVAQIASALQDAIASAVDGAANVTVTDAGGMLKIVTDTELEIVFDSPVGVNAGGGRISLSGKPYMISAQELNPGAMGERSLQITTDYNDPACQEMGIASVPTRFDGTTDDRIELTLQIQTGGASPTTADVEVALNAAARSSLDDLVSDLQSAVNTGLTNAGFVVDLLDPLIVVKRSGLDESNPTGNRIVFEGKARDLGDPTAEFVAEASILVEEQTSLLGPNGAITELGFPAGQGEIKRRKASEFFVDDVSFGGSLGVFENDVEA